MMHARGSGWGGARRVALLLAPPSSMQPHAGRALLLPLLFCAFRITSRFVASIHLTAQTSASSCCLPRFCSSSALTASSPAGARLPACCCIHQHHGPPSSSSNRYRTPAGCCFFHCRRPAHQQRRSVIQTRRAILPCRARASLPPDLCARHGRSPPAGRLLVALALQLPAD